MPLPNGAIAVVVKPGFAPVPILPISMFQQGMVNSLPPNASFAPIPMSDAAIYPPASSLRPSVQRPVTPPFPPPPLPFPSAVSQEQSIPPPQTPPLPELDVPNAVPPPRTPPLPDAASTNVFDDAAMDISDSESEDDGPQSETVHCIAIDAKVARSLEARDIEKIFAEYNPRTVGWRHGQWIVAFNSMSDRDRAKMNKNAFRTNGTELKLIATQETMTLDSREDVVTQTPQRASGTLDTAGQFDVSALKELIAQLVDSVEKSLLRSEVDPLVSSGLEKWKKAQQSLPHISMTTVPEVKHVSLDKVRLERRPPLIHRLSAHAKASVDTAKTLQDSKIRHDSKDAKTVLQAADDVVEISESSESEEVEQMPLSDESSASEAESELEQRPKPIKRLASEASRVAFGAGGDWIASRTEGLHQ